MHVEPDPVYPWSYDDADGGVGGYEGELTMAERVGVLVVAVGAQFDVSS